MMSPLRKTTITSKLESSCSFDLAHGGLRGSLNITVTGGGPWGIEGVSKHYCYWRGSMGD